MNPVPTLSMTLLAPDPQSVRSLGNVEGAQTESWATSEPDQASSNSGGFDLKDAQRVLTAALEILGQGEDLLSVLPRERCTQRVASAFNSSIGGHYRQCLDHFTNFLRALESNELDYDRGESDPRVESDPGFALQLTRRMRKYIQLLTPDDLARAVRTRCEVSYGRGDSPVIVATYGRELVYAIAHAIQHYALISVMAQLLDVTVPPHFGTAPSTVARQGDKNVHG